MAGPATSYYIYARNQRRFMYYALPTWLPLQIAEYGAPICEYYYEVLLVYL